MLLAVALGGLGRDALKVAAGLALLLVVAMLSLLTALGALTAPAAPAPSTADSSTETVAASTAAAPPALGDTRWGSGVNTYCELYVEQRFGLGNQGATAYAAYLRLAALGLVHPGPPDAPDELVYFGPSPDNEMDGHVGVYDGDGRFTSVTFYGLQQEPLARWRAPYLGWVRSTDIRTDRFGNPVAPRA